MSVERSSSLFDPRFPTYVRALIVCGVILGVMWLVGAKFEFAKKMGWVKFRKKGISSTKRKLIIIQYQLVPQNIVFDMILSKFTKLMFIL